MKRIIGSSVMLLAVVGLMVGGTVAFFSDEEVSSGNVFTAGAVDLLVDHAAQTYNGVDCQTCEVSVYSSTETEVVGSNAAAAYSGPFPKNAELIANPHPAWLNEATVTPAEWIWVTPVVDAGDVNNGAEYTFSDTFMLQGPITLEEVNLSIASDNGYKIVLNGVTIVDKLGTENAYNSLNPLTSGEQEDFEEALIQNGSNTLEITVRNKAVAGSNQASNPAGLIYKIDFVNEDCEAGVADYQATCELWAEKDLTSEKFFNFSDVKPQDDGTNLISLHVENNEAYICLNVTNHEDNENTVLEPETTAGDAGAPEGEMGEYLMVAGWYSDASGALLSPMFGPTVAADLQEITYADSDSAQDPIAPETTEYVKLAWCLGELTVSGSDFECDGNVPDINETQTDAFLADLQFYAVQSRNNNEFTCSSLNPGPNPGA